ncbi:hypothetical protein Q3O98_18075 [Ralstonia pseudosolanacearum]|nr:hypothetical protein [Ralstonia pseudosolanacearum]
MKQNTTTAALPANLQAVLTRHQAARGKFEAARDEADRIAADMQKHRTAADAAETEAQQAAAGSCKAHAQHQDSTARLARPQGEGTRRIRHGRGLPRHRRGV